MNPPKLIGALAPITAGALLLVACGDDSNDDSAAPGRAAPDSGPGAETNLTVEAHDTEFDRDAYRTAAGPVHIDYLQQGELPHSLVVEAPDGGDLDGFRLEVDGVDTDSGTVDLPAGDYVIYCDVPGHRAAGMEAELHAE